MSAAPSITGTSTRFPDIAKSGQLMCSKTGHFYLLLTHFAPPATKTRGDLAVQKQNIPVVSMRA